MPTSSTRVWVTTTIAASDSSSGNAKASGNTTKEFRVAPENTIARVDATSWPHTIATIIPTGTIITKKAT